jgi:hypothetical protein
MMIISRITKNGIIWQCKGRHKGYHSYSGVFVSLKRLVPRGGYLN